MPGIHEMVLVVTGTAGLVTVIALLSTQNSSDSLMFVVTACSSQAQRQEDKNSNEKNKSASFITVLKITMSVTEQQTQLCS